MRFAAGVVEVKKWAKTAVERVRGDGWTLPANQSPLSLLVFRIKAGPMPGLASGCRWPEWFADTIPAVRIGRHRAAGHGGLATRRELGKLGRKGRRVSWPVCRGVVVRNRLFTQSDVAALRRLIRCHPSWGRTRLSQEACTLLDWFQPNGRAKERACRVALLKLEALGYLALPPRIIERGGRPPLVRPELAEAVVPESMTTMPDTVEVRLVGTRVESQTWNGLVGKYHYLGLATPVGRFVRYLIYGASRLLGAISFSECAWNLRARDDLLAGLGFDQNGIRDSVICNNRFLILPSVNVHNLASRVLSLSLHRVPHDWRDKFHCVPLIAETFVDPTRYAGTCYLAANWVCIGHSRGFSKCGSKHVNRNAPKLLMVRGLTPSIHRRLLAELGEQRRRAA